MFRHYKFTLTIFSNQNDSRYLANMIDLNYAFLKNEEN
jgi:hypothetical protein